MEMNCFPIQTTRIMEDVVQILSKKILQAVCSWSILFPLMSTSTSNSLHPRFKDHHIPSVPQNLKPWNTTSVQVRDVQANENSGIYRYLRICLLWDPANVITQDKKSYDMLLINCKNRKVSGIQPGSKGPRTMQANFVVLLLKLKGYTLGDWGVLLMEVSDLKDQGILNLMDTTCISLL